MKRLPLLFILMLLPVMARPADGPAAVSSTSAPDVVSRSEWARVDLDGPLPRDMTDPEGRTRWDLRRLNLIRRSVRTIVSLEDGEIRSSDIAFLDRDPSVVKRTRAPVAGHREVVENWTLPHRDPDLLNGGHDRVFRITEVVEESRERLVSDLTVRTRRVGMGWLILPSGPREVVLQRAVVAFETEDGGLARWIVHRWIDPRYGVVAEIRGPAAVDGKRRARVEEAAVIEKALIGLAGLKIYVDEFDAPVLTRLVYGFDRGNLTPISSMTPDAHATISDLVQAGAWDFRPTSTNNAVGEVTTTSTPVDADETCSYSQCGFDIPGVKLGRDDKIFYEPDDPRITLSVIEREQRTNDVTLWLRAGVRNEGIAVGGLGEKESRFCYTSDIGQEVPLWRFAHQDAAGFYMTVGDLWSHAPFQCEQNLFNHVCPSVCGLFGCAIFAYACDGFAGTQSSEIVAEGPVTLPSGHTFNALVVRNVSDFCVNLFTGCSFDFDVVKTALYLWIVPNVGTVARLMSAQVVADVDTFTVLAETDIKFGLFPPVSIMVNGATDASVSVSWDPGLDTRRIDGYKVYWDTDSGVDSAYAFDSFQNPGQVTVDGTTATISGLTPGTQYFVTVTSMSDYTDIATGVTLTYESALFPLKLTDTPTPVPAEVGVMTAGGSCTPTVQVSGLTMNQVAEGIEACWQAVDDPCVDGYALLGASTVETHAGFSEVVSDTGAVTCHTFDSTESFFLVISNGSGEFGPWGHYRR